MRIGVISDTHGKLERFRAAVAKMGEVDLILHAGDHFKDMLDIEQSLAVPIKGVRGNCDFSGPNEEIIEAEGIRILLIHGHQYGVKGSLQRLAYRAGEVDAKVVVFGHTHVPEIAWADELLLFNPGSVTSPRGASRYPTFGILHLEKSQIYPFIEEIQL